jgi:hypothetical protein
MLQARGKKPILRSSLLLLLGSCTILASESGAFDRTLTVTGPVLLDVRSDTGGLSVTAGSSQSVVVHAVIKPVFGRLDLDLAEANIRALERNPPVEQDGNRIRIGYVKDPGLLKGVTVHFEIEVPRATEVHAQTASGGIRIDGISGTAEALSSSGKSEISNVDGGIKVTSHSGGIVIRNAHGHVTARSNSGGLQLMSIGGGIDAETTSGRTEVSEVRGDVLSIAHSGAISIDNARGTVVARNSSGSIDAFQINGAVHAETKSGAIHISQIKPAPIRALAHSGSIEVELASRGGYFLDAQSNSGRVSGPRTDTGVRLADEHNLKAQIGAGGPLVDLDTHSSKIEIR